MTSMYHIAYGLSQWQSLVCSSGYTLPPPSLVLICPAAAASKQHKIRTTIMLRNALSIQHPHISQEGLILYCLNVNVL